MGSKQGSIINAMRLKLALSQNEFARKAGIPYTPFTKIETGVIKKPSVFLWHKSQSIKTEDELIK
ncbi:MAG: helix-turn-helix transcriptional regulator [candidate division WOR-3 bacterium]